MRNNYFLPYNTQLPNLPLEKVHMATWVWFMCLGFAYFLNKYFDREKDVRKKTLMSNNKENSLEQTSSPSPEEEDLIRRSTKKQKGDGSFLPPQTLRSYKEIGRAHV